MKVFLETAKWIWKNLMVKRKKAAESFCPGGMAGTAFLFYLWNITALGIEEFLKPIMFGYTSTSVTGAKELKHWIQCELIIGTSSENSWASIWRKTTDLFYFFFFVPFMGGNSIILGLYCGDIKSFVGSLSWRVRKERIEAGLFFQILH